jgi:hypothetical protein
MVGIRVTRGAALVGSVGFNSGVVDRREVVLLTAAQIIAMNAGPVTILAAPGAGKVLIVTQILFAFTAALQFTGGGIVTFQYAGGATVHASSIPASVLTSASPSNTLLAPNTAANGIVAPTNTGITITNATAAFAAGTGTAKVFIACRTITL